MECYICYDKEKSNDKFCSNSICKCRGTNKIHISCFEKLKREYGNTCSICKSKFKENIVQREILSHKPVSYQPIFYQQEDNNYEYLQELFILEEHFENKKRIKMVNQSKKKDCCIIN
jgi:hypothetical protein